MPRSVSELRSCLGTFGFWRQYIPRYAHITAPLTALTRKNVSWCWGEEQQTAFDALKLAMSQTVALKHPDTSKAFIVVTDASDFAVGASLEQLDDQGRQRPCQYWSHSMNAAERNYPTHERELLAIVLALRTWRHLLLGSEFTIQCNTDHRPLQHFLRQSNLSPRQVRWQTFLSEYNLEIAYVPGATNNFADGLSRRPDLRLMAVAAMAPYDGWLQRIQAAYKNDQPTQALIKRARNNTSVRTKSDHYTLLHGILYWSAQGTMRVYVPDYQRLRARLIVEFHDLPIAGHFGWRKSHAALAQHYYWPRMAEDVHRYVLQCPTCQRVKPTRQPKPPLQPLEVPSRPFEQITLDWLSGFPANEQGHDSVLNIVDKFSKWAIIIPCDKHMNTKELSNVLYERVFAWIGLPSSIVGDRDTRLTAAQMRGLAKALGLKLKLSVAYHPQTDGQTEQFHSTLLQVLRAFVNKYHTDWAQHIPAVLYAYHNTIHSSTGYTPHRLLFGWCPRDLRAPLSSVLDDVDADVEQWLQDRKHELQQAQLSLEAAREAMLRAHRTIGTPHVYRSGDFVKVSTRVLPMRSTSTQVPKLQPKYIGPFTVLSARDKVVELQLPRSYELVHNKFNVEDVRPWLHSEDRELDVDYPAVEPHPALNPVVQVLDRKRLGRRPRHIRTYLDIPAQYLVVRRNGDTEWLRGGQLTSPEELAMKRGFEYKFPRTEELQCNPVRDYPARLAAQEGDASESDDEVNLAWLQELDDYYGPESPRNV